MDVQIIKGETLEVLTAFCEGEVFTAASPNPFFLDIIAKIEKNESRVRAVLSNSI